MFDVHTNKVLWKHDGFCGMYLELVIDGHKIGDRIHLCSTRSSPLSDPKVFKLQVEDLHEVFAERMSLRSLTESWVDAGYNLYGEKISER